MRQGGVIKQPQGWPDVRVNLSLAVPSNPSEYQQTMCGRRPDEDLSSRTVVHLVVGEQGGQEGASAFSVSKTAPISWLGHLACTSSSMKSIERHLGIYLWRVSMFVCYLLEEDLSFDPLLSFPRQPLRVSRPVSGEPSLATPGHGVPPGGTFGLPLVDVFGDMKAGSAAAFFFFSFGGGGAFCSAERKCDLGHGGTAGFSPCFHLPGFHVGYIFLTHSHFLGIQKPENALFADSQR